VLVLYAMLAAFLYQFGVEQYATSINADVLLPLLNEIQVLAIQ